MTRAVLTYIVTEAPGKRINVDWAMGPVGVLCRNFSNERIYSLGGRAQVPITQGIALTYPWIEQQVKKVRAAK